MATQLHCCRILRRLPCASTQRPCGSSVARHTLASLLGYWAHSCGAAAVHKLPSLRIDDAADAVFVTGNFVNALTLPTGELCNSHNESH